MRVILMNRFNLDENVYIDDPLCSNSWMDEWDLDQPLIKSHTFSVRYFSFRKFIIENFLLDDTPIDGNYYYNVNIVVKNGKADWSFFPELKDRISEMERRIEEILSIPEQDRTPAEHNELMSKLYMLKPFSSITWINPLDFKESLEIFEMASYQTVITEDEYDSYKKILSSAPFYIYGCTGFSHFFFKNNQVPKRMLPYGMYKLIDPTVEYVTPNSCYASLTGDEAEEITHLVHYSVQATSNPNAPKWPYNYKEQYFYPNDTPAVMPEYRDLLNAKFADLVNSWLKYFLQKKQEDERLIKRFGVSSVYFRTFNQKMYDDLISLKEAAKTDTYTYMVNYYWFDLMSKAAGVSGLPASHVLPNLKIVPDPIEIPREKVLRNVGLMESRQTHSFPTVVTSRHTPVVEKVVSTIFFETCELSLFSRDASKWLYTCEIDSNIQRDSVFETLHLNLDPQVQKTSLFFGSHIGESSGVRPRIMLKAEDPPFLRSTDYIWTDLQAIDHLIYTDDLNTNFFTRLYSVLASKLLEYITPLIVKCLPSRFKKIYSYISFIKKHEKVISNLNTLMDYLKLLEDCTVLDLLIEARKLIIKNDPFIKTDRFFLSEKPCYELEICFTLVRTAVEGNFYKAMEFIDDDYAKMLILDYLAFKLSRRLLISLIS